jgi:ABC-type transport system involved in cytochrome c biogenesis ATPase subunit
MIPAIDLELRVGGGLVSVVRGRHGSGTSTLLRGLAGLVRGGSW